MVDGDLADGAAPIVTAGGARPDRDGDRAITTYNDFIIALTLTSTPDARPFRWGCRPDRQDEIQWGPMAAAGVVGALPIVIFALIVQRNFVRGLTLGAVK